jgi:DNA-binding MarR family transcriptional regulator
VKPRDKSLPTAESRAETSRLPLPTLLSHALVAFTIEFDNEFEHQMPHWTTDHGPASGASRKDLWLVSLAMNASCMQFIPEQGIRAIGLVRLARTKTNFPGMVRWGYITAAPDPSDSRAKPPRSDWLVRATDKGKQAQKVWRPLFAEIEKRWQTRFGKKEMDQLRESLIATLDQIDLDLPDCLPILQFGLFNRAAGNFKRRAQTKRDDEITSRLSLSGFLSRVLLAFTIEFESESDLSLAICANVLRVLNEKGVRARELPALSGVSKESISMAMGILQKAKLAAVESEADAARTRRVLLTAKGQRAQDAYRKLLAAIEVRWQTHFGEKTITNLRGSLEKLALAPSVGDRSASEPDAGQSPLFRCLEPYPGNWRAKRPSPTTLPHFPMVLHRGGFPDGS